MKFPVNLAHFIWRKPLLKPPRPAGWLVPPRNRAGIAVKFDRLFTAVPTIRPNEVRDKCQAFRKSICLNRGACTLPIFGTYRASHAPISSKNSTKPSKTRVWLQNAARRPPWPTTWFIKCKGTPGRLKGVHNPVTSAMYLRMKPCKPGDAPLAPSAIWDPCCGGAQASEQDFGDNIDQNQWDMTWN